MTRAITGTSSVSRSAMPPKPPGRAAAQYSTPLSPLVFFMSAPAQKARSPVAPSTTTRTSSRDSMSVQMRCSSASVARSTAFITSGRSMVTEAT